MTYPLVQDLAAIRVPITVTSRVLGFSKQAFYQWQKRPCSPRDEEEARLINSLRDAHDDDPAFGYRLLTDEITADGHVASERRVWRLCSREGIVSVISRRGRGKGRRPGPAMLDDKVQRVFVANGPNEIWLTDITEHRPAATVQFSSAADTVSARGVESPSCRAPDRGRMVCVVRSRCVVAARAMPI